MQPGDEDEGRPGDAPGRPALGACRRALAPGASRSSSDNPTSSGLSTSTNRSTRPTTASTPAGRRKANRQPNADAAAAGPDASPAGPRLEWAQIRFDAGRVPQDEPVQHVFVLRNVGTDVLHIRRPTGS